MDLIGWMVDEPLHWCGVVDINPFINLPTKTLYPPWQYTPRSLAANSTGVTDPSPIPTTPPAFGARMEERMNGGRGAWSAEGGKYRAGSNSGRGLFQVEGL